MKKRTLFADKNRRNEQASRKCYIKQPCISSCPKSPMTEPQFNYEFTQFTMDLPIYQQVKQNIKYLYELYSRMCEEGGLACVLAYNKFGSVIKLMSVKFPQIASLSTENVLEHYLKFYLFCFQVVIKTGKKIQNDKLMCLLVTRFLSDVQIIECLKNQQKGIKLYDQDILALVNLCQMLDLKLDIFNLQSMKQKCGQQTLKAVIQQIDQSEVNDQNHQNSNTSIRYCQGQHSQFYQPTIGFSKFRKANAQELDVNKQIFFQHKLQLTLKQYLQYYQTYDNKFYQTQTKSSTRKNRILQQIVNNQYSQRQKVIYGVQFDPKVQYYIQQVCKKVNETFLGNKQKFDILSYSDQDIPGITLPNFSFQLPGCWSGGRQQPFASSKIDINLGPDQTEWYCISALNVNKFFQIFKTQFCFSFQKVEGMWFQDVDWFIQNKIPIKKCVQKKGDGIIIGSGSLSWHKSKGKSLHTSWNFLPKTQKQIAATSNKCIRLKQNWNSSIKQIQKQIKIAIKSIFLRVLNHTQSKSTIKKQSTQLSPSSIIMIRQSLKKWFSDQQKILNQLIVKQELTDIKFKKYHLFDAQSFCSRCQSQILSYFVNINGLNCLQCTSKSFSNKSIFELADKTLYYKHDPFWLYNLVYYGNNRSPKDQSTVFYQQYQQLCSGQFISNNQNCTKLNHKSSSSKCQKDEWDRILDENYEQQCRTVEYRHYINVSTLIAKKLVKNKQNINEDVTQNNVNQGAQTHLSLLQSIPDQQIQNYLRQRNSQYIFQMNRKALMNQSQSATENQLSSQAEKRRQRRMRRIQKNYGFSSGTQCSSQHPRRAKNRNYRQKNNRGKEKLENKYNSRYNQDPQNQVKYKKKLNDRQHYDRQQGYYRKGQKMGHHNKSWKHRQASRYESIRNSRTQYSKNERNPHEKERTYKHNLDVKTPDNY